MSCGRPVFYPPIVVRPAPKRRPKKCPRPKVPCRHDQCKKKLDEERAKRRQVEGKLRYYQDTLRYYQDRLHECQDKLRQCERTKPGGTDKTPETPKEKHPALPPPPNQTSHGYTISRRGSTKRLIVVPVLSGGIGRTGGQPQLHSARPTGGTTSTSTKMLNGNKAEKTKKNANISVAIKKKKPALGEKPMTRKKR